MKIGDCTKIAIGSTEISKVYAGSTLLWPSGISPDPYSGITYPDGYYRPDIPYGYTEMIGFFIPDKPNTISVYLDALSTACEGGGDGYAMLQNRGGIFFDSSTNSLSEESPLSSFDADGGWWVTVVENWELWLNGPGNVFSTNGATGMVVTNHNIGRCEMCHTFIDFDRAVTQCFSGITFLGIIGESGNTYYACVEDDDPVYMATFTSTHMANFTNLVYFFCEDTNWDIPLYNSTGYTADSMKFNVKFSPGVTFVVDDNSYWRGIIPWAMAEYYNVTFKDRNGNIMTQ